MFDYPALQALSAVAREGSFERAATVLGVTRSAVSQRVRALEERLGTVLIARGQPCVATTTGLRLCAHVDSVRLLEDELAEALPDLSLAPAGRRRPALRIAVNADSLGTWIVPGLAAFTDRTGAVVDLVLHGEDHTADRLRSGEVIAAVTTDAVPVQGCRIRTLGTLRYVAVASRSFAERWFPEGTTASALAEAPVLRFDDRDHLQERWAEAVVGAVALPPPHRIPSTQGFLDASLAGLGWSLCPLPLAAPHLSSGQLRLLAPDHPLDVPLHWQCVRLGAALLDILTREVLAAAQAGLIQPAPRPGQPVRTLPRPAPAPRRSG